MGQLAAYCCRDDHEVANEQVDGYNQNNNGITYPYIKQELTKKQSFLDNSQEQIFQTKPPCWFSHRCDCPCHHGGKCLFKLKSN